MQIRKNKGFTLIELLVVIVIIGLLATVSLAILSGLQHSAYSTNALTTMKSAQTAVAVCVTDGFDLSNPAAGGQMCPADSASQNWPELNVKDWSYTGLDTSDPNNIKYTADSDYTGPNSKFTHISCSISKCTAN